MGLLDSVSDAFSGIGGEIKRMAGGSGALTGGAIGGVLTAAGTAICGPVAGIGGMLIGGAIGREVEKGFDKKNEKQALPNALAGNPNCDQIQQIDDKTLMLLLMTAHQRGLI